MTERTENQAQDQRGERPQTNTVYFSDLDKLKIQRECANDGAKKRFPKAFREVIAIISIRYI